MLLLWTIFIATAVLAQDDPPLCSDCTDECWLPDPVDCYVYWYCANPGADPGSGRCPDEMVFNPDTQECDPNIECWSTEISTTDTTETTEITEPTTTPRPLPPRNVCEGLPNNHFVNNPTGCRSYFVCLNETPFPRQCGVGFNFNEELQICDRPSFTPCSNDDFQCPFFGFSRWEVPGSCTEYNFCFAGQHRIQECGTRLQFDPSIALCAPEETVGCTRDLCPLIDDIDNIIYHPSTNDCHQYYVCYEGNLKLQFCSAGLYWDQTSRTCQRPEYSDCELATTEASTDPTEPTVP